MVGHRRASSTGGSRSSCVLLGRLRRQAIKCLFAIQMLNAAFRGVYYFPPGTTAMAAAVTAKIAPLGEEDAGDVTPHANAPPLGVTPNISPRPTFQLGPDGDEIATRMLVAATELPPTAALFSADWATEFGVGTPGCNLARGSYLWRRFGFGSNLNNLLNAWVNTLAVEKWTDMAVVITDSQMAHIKCDERSLGKASTGWECLFRPMPHLCVFPTDEAWQTHMMSKNLNATQVEESGRLLGLDAIRNYPEKIVAALGSLEIDHIGALAVLAKYVWSNITPWLMGDANLIARAPVSPAFQRSPFVALHVRRGDKVQIGEARSHTCEEYLAAAVKYLEAGSDNMLNVEDIRGIWVASDDSTAVDTIKEIAPDYFPNVENSMIYWISCGVQGGPEVGKTATHTNKATYADLAYLLADLQQCILADVFVGTFSSNLGRLLVLLRESIGHKKRSSALSVDWAKWEPGRRRR